jgi:hypothetical protein
MGQQEPASHWNTTDCTHMDYNQWSGGISYGFMTTNGISFCSDLLAMLCQTFHQLLYKIWHGLTPMGQQEPASHWNTTYWIFMDDNQWSGGNSYGFMTTNGISFCSDLLAMLCQTFHQLLYKIWHGLTPMGQQEPA